MIASSDNRSREAAQYPLAISLGVQAAVLQRCSFGKHCYNLQVRV